MRDSYELGAKGCCDELRRGVLVFGLSLDQARDLCAVVGVQCLVDLVKEVKRGWVAALNGKDESERNEGFLPTRELVHLDLLAGSGKSHAHLHAKKRGK